MALFVVSYNPKQEVLNLCVPRHDLISLVSDYVSNLSFHSLLTAFADMPHAPLPAVESIRFDPTGLEESTTPAAVLASVESRQFSRALPMALCLNEEELLRATWQRVPPDEVRPLTRYIAIALFVTNNHPPSMSRLGGSRRARAAAALR